MYVCTHTYIHTYIHITPVAVANSSKYMNLLVFGAGVASLCINTYIYAAKTVEVLPLAI